MKRPRTFLLSLVGGIVVAAGQRGRGALQRHHQSLPECRVKALGTSTTATRMRSSPPSERRFCGRRGTWQPVTYTSWAKYIGTASMTQVSVGFQAAARPTARSFSSRTNARWTNSPADQFAFDAGVSAVAITASASGSVGTEGVTGAASGGRRTHWTSGSYYKGVAVFTIVKGGAMYQATVAGQKFSYKPRGSA